MLFSLLVNYPLLIGWKIKSISTVLKIICAEKVKESPFDIEKKVVSSSRGHRNIDLELNLYFYSTNSYKICKTNGPVIIGLYVVPSGHVFERESTALKEKYEEQIAALREELEVLRGKLVEEREALALRYDADKEVLEEQLAQQIREELEVSYSNNL